MKLVFDEKQIPRLQLAGSIGVVILLVVVLGFFFIRQDIAEYNGNLQSLEDAQIRQQQDRLVDQVDTAKSYLSFMRSRTEMVLRNTIREQVDEAYNLADSIYQREHGKRSDADIKALIVEALRNLRFFNGRGYFFIDGIDGRCILLPTAPEREGTSLLDNKDDTGHYIMRGLIDAAQMPVGSGFSRYRWYMPGDNREMHDKIAYVRLFKPFNWVIGTGEYIANVENSLKKDALERLRSFRFGHDGYIVILGQDGKILSSPVRPDLEGASISDMTAAARTVGDTIMAQAHQGDGFVRYNWYRPGEHKLSPKISFVSRMDDWGWVLVSGVYLDDIEKAVAAQRADQDQRIHDKVALTLTMLALGICASAIIYLIFARLLRGLIAGYKTDLERQNEELRKAARELFLVNFLVDNSAEMIFLTDENWVLTYVNTHVYDTLGWTRDQLIGRKLTDIATSLTGSADGGYTRFEARLQTHSGARLQVEIGAKELRYDGRLYHFAIARDITERKRWESDLAHKTAELERSNAELEAFAYVTSHDLRQPLRMVSSFLTLLERRLGDGLDAEGREYLNFARDGAHRMDRLIIDLLEYSRVGRVNKGYGEVPMGDAATEALANLRAIINETGARIEVQTSLPSVWGNAEELSRLFQNLIGNALKYRSDVIPEITVSCQDKGDQWQFSVRDNGIGIAPEFHQRIFGLFQRLHGGDKYEGTGIGLAVCRKIIERHGGNLWVESQSGAGSTFLFTLPRLEDARARHAENQPDPPAIG